MNRRLEAGWKRITSGFLAFTIVSILILGNSGIAFAEEYDDRFYREETDLSELGEFSKATVSNASFKNSKKDDVVISILSEEGITVQEVWLPWMYTLRMRQEPWSQTAH